MCEQNRLTDYSNCPEASERAQDSLTPGPDSNIEHPSKGVHDDSDWDFGGAICVEAVHRVDVKDMSFRSGDINVV